MCKFIESRQGYLHAKMHASGKKQTQSLSQIWARVLACKPQAPSHRYCKHPAAYFHQMSNAGMLRSSVEEVTIRGCGLCVRQANSCFGSFPIG